MTLCGTMTLVTLGVPQEQICHLSQTLGLPVRPAPEGTAENAEPAAGKGATAAPGYGASCSGHGGAVPADIPACLIIGEAGTEAISATFQKGYRAWIELGPPQESTFPAALGRLPATGIYASFTTLTAARLELAHGLWLAIQQAWPVSGLEEGDVELAVHEAIVNALVHGNLQVESMKGLSLGAIEQYSSDLGSHMADPALARRRVEITATFEAGALEVEVADEGSGFTTDVPPDSAACGRGLALIAMLTAHYELLDGGRRIRMRFPS